MKINVIGSGSIGSDAMSASCLIDEHILTGSSKGVNEL